jgi:ankyrin repeat protein
VITIRIQAVALSILILFVPFRKSYGLTLNDIRDISTTEPEQAIKTLTGILQKDPKDASALFLLGVELRSGFEVKESSKVFGALIAKDPNSPEGLAAACILGVDLSKDAASALYYYNGLLALAEQHPDSIGMNWSAAILARALTRYTLEYNLWDEVRNRILLAGVRYYQRVMDLMAPSEGPYILHLTYGNLLDELEAHDQALVERKTALRLARFGTNLHAIARTYYQLGEYDQAIPYIKEAIEMEPKTAKYYGQYAEILQKQGAYKEAIQKAEIAATFQPQWDDALKCCMFMARDLGDVKSAYEFSQQQVQRYPQDQVSRVWNARLAAMNSIPNASQLLEQAGSLNHAEKWEPWSENHDPQAANDPWWNAAGHGDAVTLKSMISPETLEKRTRNYSQTALMIAAAEGYEQMASDLIKAGAEIDAVDVNKDTALHYASQFKNPRLVELLLEAGANPNLKDKFGETPLVKCTCNIDRQGLVALLSHKADPSIAQPRFGAPILFAAGHGDIDAVKLLLSHGAAVESRDRSGATPLIVSVKMHNRFSHPWIVNPLLQASADIHAKDKDGRTALHHAINPQLNIPSIDLLLEKGAQPAVPDNFGTTPITQARALGFEQIAKQLEAKAGKTEQFVFPKFAAPDPSLSTDEVRATYFVIPILMAQGHPLGHLTGLAPNDKGAAREELKNMFGIDSAKGLKFELASMETFHPSLRDDAGDLPLPEGKVYSTLLKSAVEKIHQSENPSAIDETGWVKSHIMYLADLGVTAGYLKQEEASPLINAASADLAKKYSSWKDYLASFLLGAKLHNGWEYQRYKNIADLITATAPAWM